MTQIYGAHVAVATTAVGASKTPIEYLLDKLEGGIRNLHVATVLNHDTPDWATFEISTHQEQLPYDEAAPVVLFRLTVNGK